MNKTPDSIFMFVWMASGGETVVLEQITHPQAFGQLVDNKPPPPPPPFSSPPPSPAAAIGHVH